MKKISALLIMILLATSIFVSCKGEKENLSTLEAIKKSGVIKFGLDDAYPPMEFRDEQNNLVGFDIDVANEIAKKIGVKAEFVTSDFNGIILALQGKKFDAIMSALSITDKRKESIDFAGPYIYGGQVIIVKNGNNEITTPNDLKGKVLGCQLGSSGDKAGSNIEGLKDIVKYDKITEALNDVKIGRLDAVIADHEVGAYYAAKQGDEFKVCKEFVSKEPMGIGLRKEDKDLTAVIQKAFEDLKEDGTLSTISEKWFGYDIYQE